MAMPPPLVMSLGVWTDVGAVNSAGTDPSGGPGGDASVRATFDTRPPLSSRPTISIAPLHDQYACGIVCSQNY